jgi:hypothetical protein
LADASTRTGAPSVIVVIVFAAVVGAVRRAGELRGDAVAGAAGAPEEVAL